MLLLFTQLDQLSRTFTLTLQSGPIVSSKTRSRACSRQHCS